MEPRARAGRHKGSLNFGKELTGFLYAYGAPTHPDLDAQASAAQPDSAAYLATLPPTSNTAHRPTPFHAPFPETLRVLDEIVTDFVIETCHQAVAHAGLARRQKLTINDFKFVLRKDRMKLGRVHEMFVKAKKQEKEKKLNLMDFGGIVGGGAGGGAGGLAGLAGLGGGAGGAGGGGAGGGLGGGRGGGLRVDDLMDLGQLVGEEGTGRGKGRGRGRRKTAAGTATTSSRKRKADDVDAQQRPRENGSGQEARDHDGEGGGGDGDGEDDVDVDDAASDRSDRSASKSVKRARSELG